MSDIVILFYRIWVMLGWFLLNVFYILKKNPKIKIIDFCIIIIFVILYHDEIGKRKIKFLLFCIFF
jgi:hypothetical protein